MDLSGGKCGIILLPSGQVQAKAGGMEIKSSIISREGCPYKFGVEFSLSTHIMQRTLIPQKVCSTMDRMVRNVLWGSTEEHRRIHPVNWETVTLPKTSSGLGIRCAEGRNLTPLGNFAWRVTSDGRPWAGILRRKYGE